MSTLSQLDVILGMDCVTSRHDITNLIK